MVLQYTEYGAQGSNRYLPVSREMELAIARALKREADYISFVPYAIELNVGGTGVDYMGTTLGVNVIFLNHVYMAEGVIDAPHPDHAEDGMESDHTTEYNDTQANHDEAAESDHTTEYDDTQANNDEAADHTTTN